MDGSKDRNGQRCGRNKPGRVELRRARRDRQIPRQLTIYQLVFVLRVALIDFKKLNCAIPWRIGLGITLFYNTFIPRLLRP